MGTGNLYPKLDWRRYPAATGMIFFVLTLIFVFGLTMFVAGSHFYWQWRDGVDQVSTRALVMPEADYSLLWSAGNMAAAGHPVDVYDGLKLLTWRQRLFGPIFNRLDWMYPPPVLALGVGVSRFPLLSGYFVWITMICGASVWVLRAAGLSWRVVMLGLFGPPTWTCIALGQHAPLVASLVVAGLLRSRAAPVRAGIQVALATFKPHLGILVPIVWIAQRRWTAFVTAAIVTLLLAAGSTALLGVGIWSAFLRGTGLSGRDLLEHFFKGGFPSYAASVFWMARSFGGSLAVSYAAQAVAAVLAVAGTWMAARHGNDTAAGTVAVCLTLLVSPYLYSFDIVGYSIVVAMLFERRRFALLPMLLWLAAGVSELFTFLTGIAVLPALIALAALLAWREFGVSPALPALAGAVEHA
ncbi:MAG: glycosyltransferase family 87 protein [Rhodospirillales bacterium]|nr:glycosyltransferase family 87 protein [Rhodospirillales bacterium]